MTVAIVDSGGANLASVADAVERLGRTPVITDSADVIASAERMILPGVGHADTAMQALQCAGLVAVVRGFRRPVLGICVGMHQLCGWCEEGGVNGLSLITDAPSRRFVPEPSRAVPHMGWNQLSVVQHHDPVMQGLSQEPLSHMYFIHTYYVAADDLVDGSALLATTEHGGCRIASAVRLGNYWGVQFHPERSGDGGHLVLRNFLELDDANLSSD